MGVIGLTRPVFPVPASSRARPLPQVHPQGQRAALYLWERVYPRRGQHRSKLISQTNGPLPTRPTPSITNT